MKAITLIVILTTISFGVFSQDFEVPKKYKLEKAEDYSTYEKDVLLCINWLMENPINEQTTKRKEANTFILKWLEGSPNLTIDIKQEIVTFMGTSPDLLMVFMTGCAKYSLESRDFKGKLEGNLAGIESVIEFYSKNKELMPKDKNVEKYIKMKEKGTLKDYIEKNI